MSTDTEKAFDKMQWFLMTKALKNLRIEVAYSNTIKAIQYNNMAVLQPILLKKGKTESIFSQKISVVKLESLLSLPLFNVVIKALTRKVRQEKEIKCRV